ncbi:S1C family serine protease [Nakamurella panacisegetis]|uniref:S1C family serine protease n=1 Tax=Nakamurella panacisegetis TaxID=1090615 RepID=UPI000B2C52C6|nr:trypsin-like peptidase domain-containing protein [Nakamurella panacisegetis]
MIVTATGDILTNAHVVSGATSVKVTLSNSTTAMAATIVSADNVHDLALLRVKGQSNLHTVIFGDSSKTVPGDGVIAVGYALALTGGPTVTAGIISAINREASTETATGATETLTGLLQTDAPISSGNSGGPLVDSAGHGVGMNTMVATSSRDTSANGIGFAIAANTITSLLPKLRTGQ